MKFENFLQQIFYRFGSLISAVNGKVAAVMIVVGIGFSLYALVYRKEKDKKKLGLDGFSFFFISGIMIALYPVKLIFGQLLMKLW